MQSYTCQKAKYGARVVADGRDTGIIIGSASTASTSLVMRDIAREMTTSGSTFGACYRHWLDKYMDLRDAGIFPSMASVTVKSRQTVTSMLFLAAHLMMKDLPLWAFRCSSCQDKDGRWRVITAYGIWLGFLKRLASGEFTNPL